MSRARATIEDTGGSFPRWRIRVTLPDGGLWGPVDPYSLFTKDTYFMASGPLWWVRRRARRLERQADRYFARAGTIHDAS